MLKHVTNVLPTNIRNLPARYVLFALAGLFVGGLVAYIALYGYGPVTSVSNDANLTGTQLEQSTSTAFTLSEAKPTRLRIPSVGIDADFESPLGLQENDEVEVPEGYDTVGWYKYGPTPGELGPAVVIGHVDSYQGPEVFYDLRNVVVGDEVIVEREDGSTATFVVTRLETHSQSGFPAAKVYGNIDHAGLRLITCSGTYDQGEQRYSHNLIVFAELVTPESSTSTNTTSEEG